MILDENGLIIAGGIIGELICTSKLSGAQPEVAISLREPQVLENAAFHPCVKLPKFDRDKVMPIV